MRIAIIGAGGHGRELSAICQAAHPASTLLYFDDHIPEGTHPFGEVAGSTNDVASSQIDAYLIGVGDPEIRSEIASLPALSTIEPLTAVHPHASVGPRCLLHPGVVVGAGSVLTCDIRLGQHTHVHSNVTISHDVTLGAFVTVAPSASLAGAVSIGDGAWVGIAASIKQGVKVGARAILGAGSVVLRDVQPDTTVMGVPARPR